MPTKPKPTTVKPSAPKAEPSLYKAIRERLETKDRETLHDRTKKAVEAVEHLLEGIQPAQENAMSTVPVTNIVNQATPTAMSTVPVTNIVNQATPTPWSLEGLVVDPGEEAVGQWGFFWGSAGDVELRFDACDEINSGKVPSYSSKFDGWYRHFAYIPNFPGASLLKATTGYEAP